MSDTISFVERVLNAWSEYAGYDPKQMRFNLMSWEFEYNRICKRMQKITEGYDHSGTLAVLYAKNAFRHIMSETQVQVMSVLEDSSALAEERAMWALFNEPAFSALEDAYIRKINHLTEQILGRKALGEADRAETLETLNRTVDAIIEEIDTCHLDVYRIGGPVQPVTHISPAIHVFPRLANCVLALESAAADGAYCCYIASMGTVEGYFGFFFKSNGTIFSVHDRVDEPYIQAHEQHRNNRWMEGKSMRLFPYDGGIIKHTDFDYKGYATKAELLIEDNLLFNQMGVEHYLPVVMGISLLSAKYAGATFSEDRLVMVNSLMPKVLERGSAEHALAIPAGSAVAEVSAGYTPGFSMDTLLDGSAGKDIERRVRGEEGSRCCFQSDNQLLIEMYGTGFRYDPSELIADTTYAQLPGKAGDVPYAEFIGTQARMDMLAYYEVRKHLAQHIRDEILREYLAFGGVEKVIEWWEAAIRERYEHIVRLCLDYYKQYKEGATDPNIDFGGRVSMVETNGSIPNGLHHSTMRFFNIYDEHRHLFLDGDTGTRCSIFFIFNPCDWQDLERFSGQTVPRIVKGYTTHRRGRGNSILDATDAVNDVGTPFEMDEATRNPYYRSASAWLTRDECEVAWPEWVPANYRKKTKRRSSAYGFQVSIGFSKRHFSALQKHLGYLPNVP